MKELQPGDILAYIPTPEVLFYQGIALGTALAGIPATYAHIGVWAGAGVEVAAYSEGVQAGGKLPFPCDVYRPTVTEEGLNRGLDWLQGRIGKTPYAWWNIPLIWLIRRFGIRKFIDWSDSTLICSDLAASFLNKCGLDAFPDLFSCEVMPADFARGVGLVKVGSIINGVFYPA